MQPLKKSSARRELLLEQILNQPPKYMNDSR